MTSRDDHPEDGIDWQPLWTVKINFDSHRLDKENDQLLTFKPTRFALYFGWAFIIVGVVITISMAFLIKDAPWFNLFGAIFSAIGLFFLYLANRQVSFNHENGFYTRGRGAPLLLLQIRALQLLSEHNDSDDGNYTSYQLNLILSDDKRQNIVIYANRQNAIDDAKKLADFLDLTLWSNIEFGEYIP